MEGIGKLYFASGDVYEGEYVKNIKNGYGILTYANGEKFEGIFINDQQVETMDDFINKAVQDIAFDLFGF